MKYINFSELPICDQKWETMPIIEGGRLCEKCNTKMIDFSEMSNLEIIKLHAETEGRVCGYYSPSQLTSPFQEKAELDAPSFLAKAIIGLSTLTTTLFLNPTPSIAQVSTEIVPKKNKNNPNQIKHPNTGQVQEVIVLKGQLLDEERKPLPYASVYIKETEWGVSTDSQGLFTLALKKEDVCKKDTFTVVYFFLGFQTVERKISCTSLDRDELWLGEQILKTKNEIIISKKRFEPPLIGHTSFGIAPQPTPKKKWWQKGFLGRIFRKKK